MFSFLPAPIRGVLSLLMFGLNTLFWVPLLIAAALCKLVVPVGGWRRAWGHVCDWIANRWVGLNRLHTRLTNKVRWDVSGVDDLKRRDWYLVMSNHQSWVDILVLQDVFHRRIPLLKFFLKRELIFVPLLGLAWWALDFPFMKRYSKAKLAKKPHLKGRDLATTQKACRKFATLPVAVMNFVEGTRFSPEKKAAQDSPYHHLLRPKAGGMTTVLTAMGGCITRVLNVTISYPAGKKSFWAFVSGKINEVRVRVEALDLTPELLGLEQSAAEHRAKVEAWLNGLWAEKDRLMHNLLPAPEPAPVKQQAQ